MQRVIGSSLFCSCKNVSGVNKFRSLVSIQGPEGYGPSTLPLRHSEVSDKSPFITVHKRTLQTTLCTQVVICTCSIHAACSL